MGGKKKTKNSDSSLSKSIDETTALLEEEDVTTEDELEKALDNALDVLEKAAPPAEDGEDEDEYGEEEEEEEERMSKKKRMKMAKKSVSYDSEPDFDALSKAIPDAMSEDTEAAEVIDAIPFVKALLDSMEDQVTDLVKAIVHVSDRLDRMEAQMGKTARLEVAQAKMVKSIRSDLKAVGDVPLQRKGAVNSQDLHIMRKAEDGTLKKVNLSKAGALEKLTALHKSGKIDLNTVISSESRIQKGIPLQPEVQALIVE